MTFLIGILLAAIAAYALGILWYSPWFLGKPWNRLANVPDGSRPLWLMIPPFVGWVLIAYVLSLVLVAMGAYSPWQGVEGAFWAWLGLTMPFGMFLVVYERRPIALFLIDQVYYLLALMMMGAMLATW